MKKLVGFFGMLFGSSIGGWLGGQIGLMSMIVLSAIGAGVGFYYGRRLLDD
jgi:hypothetical protein